MAFWSQLWEWVAECGAAHCVHVETPMGEQENQTANSRAVECLDGDRQCKFHESGTSHDQMMSSRCSGKSISPDQGWCPPAEPGWG